MKIRITSSVPDLLKISIDPAVARRIAGTVMTALPVGGPSDVVVTRSRYGELHGWSLNPNEFRPMPALPFGNAWEDVTDNFVLVRRPAMPTPHLAGHQSPALKYV